MKAFEFEGGTLLKVTDVDYMMLREAASERFAHLGAKETPIIDQVRDSLKISDIGYITGIKASFGSDSERIVNRLVLNQLLKTIK